MLEEEDEVDPDLFSAESAQLVYPLQMDEGTENLVRLPLDLLVKFRKATWLARRWLELYDKRTHDLSAKLHKVLALETKLTTRLRSLDGEIVQHEQQLETKTGELHRLMEREGRSDGLGFALYDIDAKSAALKTQLEKLRAQRDAITARVAQVTRKGRAHEYRAIRLDFEKNKLQRYLLERQLATLDYQRHLSDQDRQVELQVRPSLIRHTNHVQDTCERLEETIRDERRERDNIRSALLPIQEDRQTLRDKLSRSSTRDGSAGPGGGGGGSRRGLRAGEAKFVRTYHVANRLSRPARLDSFRAPKALTVPGWVSPPSW